MGELLGAIVIGLIVGALARLFLPGKQAVGILATMLIGVVGAIIGNYVGEAISPDGTMHWILSVLFAIGLLMLYVGAKRRTA